MITDAGAVPVAAMVGVFAFLVFMPAVECEFLNWDDPHYVSKNPVVLAGLSWAGVQRAWTTPVFNNWSPLTTMSHQLDATLFGQRAAGFHLMNVGWHAVSAGLVCLALARMTGATGLSAVCATLFAVHPLRVESVVWIAERKDVLSVCFVAIALVAYEWYRRRPGTGRYLVVFAAMLCSLLAKPTAVTLPFLLLLLDWWPFRRLCPQSIVEKIPLFALSVLFSGITLMAQRGAIVAGESAPLFVQRVPNALYALHWYVAKTLVPVRLHPAHEWFGTQWPAWLVIVCLAGALATAVLAWAIRRQCPAVTVGIGWYACALVPMLGIVQTGFQSFADRFTYLPHIGLFMALVWGAHRLFERLRCPPAFQVGSVAAILVVFVSLDRLQIAVWRTSESLWNHVVSLEPDNALSHANLGMAYYEQGRLDAAVDQYRRSLEIRDTERARTALGLALADSGRLDEAAREYAAALMLCPDSVDAHNNLGIVLARQGRMSEALAHFEAACRLDPTDVEAAANRRMAQALFVPAGEISPEVRPR